MIINVNTKIGAILKHNPKALDAIVSLSPKFEKLRNPILRKVIAGRSSITMASRIGGCAVKDFFNVLQPLGFEIDQSIQEEKKLPQKEEPAFLQQIEKDKIHNLDVRADIESGNDPLKIIMKAMKELPNGHVLNIINSFEPTPLIHLLEKQGYESFVKNTDPQVFHTYFFKKDHQLFDGPRKENWSEGWDEIVNAYKENLAVIDVTELPMPLPMHTILDALESLPDDKALFVYHKRIPVFLLPELEDRGFHFRIKEINEGSVHLLIYKK
ncbi:MAG: DUF2249 domain-containing protein [Bacteroidetes bacterium]|nr:DUF2249 domain-containing protein [Bacteroidota bacterium]